jgi:hypothetical protein
MAIETLRPGVASNCWRPKSWKVVSDILTTVADEAGKMERSTKFGNHVLALSIIVGVFEAEKQAHVTRADDTLNHRAETTLGYWLSTNELNEETKVPMLSEMVNKSIILYTLSATNEMLGHDSFTAMRAWSLCRRLLDVALWALLNDVTMCGSDNDGGNSSNTSSLRILQLKLLSELFEGLDSVSHDKTTSFVPTDGRGHLFGENCERIVSMLERSREPWAYRLRNYCQVPQLPH